MQLMYLTYLKPKADLYPRDKFYSKTRNIFSPTTYMQFPL